MIKKIFSLVSLSVLAASCGKSAQAQELIYAPSNLQGNPCGDQSIGNFTCNADSIRFEYTSLTFQNKKWINNAASGETPKIFGPYLNLEPGIGSFSSLQVTASVDIFLGYFEGGDYFPVGYDPNQHLAKLFDIVLVGNCKGSEVVFLRKTVNEVGYKCYTSTLGRLETTCNYVTNFPEQNIVLAADVQDSSCKDFELQARNVNAEFTNISPYNLPFNLNYVQIIGER